MCVRLDPKGKYDGEEQSRDGFIVWFSRTHAGIAWVVTSLTKSKIGVSHFKKLYTNPHEKTWRLAMEWNTENIGPVMDYWATEKGVR